MVEEVACRGDLGGSQALTQALVLASTSPQRRAILGQLQIAFESVSPRYEEHDPVDADPVELVRRHAEGKAQSVHVEGRVTLGVDTTVHLGRRTFGKPEGATHAREMLAALSARRHTVISGVCLLGTGTPVVDHATTTVSFRRLSAAEVDAYVRTGEWRNRAGGYAIQGLGGRLVTRIEGDYLNVVGLPGALLVALLDRYAPHHLDLAQSS